MRVPFLVLWGARRLSVCLFGFGFSSLDLKSTVAAMSCLVGSVCESLPVEATEGSQEESITRDCMEGVGFVRKRAAERVQGKKKAGSASKLSGILRELRQGRTSPVIWPVSVSLLSAGR